LKSAAAVPCRECAASAIGGPCGLAGPITRRNELLRQTSALFGCCDRGEALATGDATSSIVAISWVGPPMTFKIYPDARQGSPWHFRAPATPFVLARRDRPLTHRDQAACDRPAGWRPMPLPRCCDVAAPIPCANLSRSADLVDAATQEAAISLPVATIDAKSWQSLRHGKIGLGRKFCALEI